MRLLNRPLAFLLALALLAASVILIVEVTGYALHSRHVWINWETWYRWAKRTRWNRAVVKTWSIILAAAGLLLLAAELKRPRLRRLPVRAEQPDTDAALTRAGVAGALRAAATDVDGIRTARVAVSRRKATVTATSVARDRAAAQALTEPVTRAVQDRLRRLELTRPPRLSVRTTARSR